MINESSKVKIYRVIKVICWEGSYPLSDCFLDKNKAIEFLKQYIKDNKKFSKFKKTDDNCYEDKWDDIVKIEELTLMA